MVIWMPVIIIKASKKWPKQNLNVVGNAEKDFIYICTNLKIYKTKLIMLFFAILSVPLTLYIYGKKNLHGQKSRTISKKNFAVICSKMSTAAWVTG